MGRFPGFSRGQGVPGSGRSSRWLARWALFPEQVGDNRPADKSTGIEPGRASVGRGDAHKTVVSTGCKSCYKNRGQFTGAHVIRTFKEGFYGETREVAIAGYSRPEKNFGSLGSLITAFKVILRELRNG